MQEERSLAVTVKNLTNQFHRYMENIKKDITAKIKVKNMTESQGRIIHYLHINDKKDIYQKDIEKKFNIRRSTATVILQLMEKNGYITREVSSFDARLKKIILSKKARDLHPIAHAEIIRAEKQAAKGISKEDVDTFLRVANQILKNIS